MSHWKPKHNWDPTKSNLIQNQSKQLNKNRLVLTHNVLDIDKTESKVEKWVDHWEEEIEGIAKGKNERKKVFVLYFSCCISPCVVFFVLYACCMMCCIACFIYPVCVACMLLKKVSYLRVVFLYYTFHVVFSCCIFRVLFCVIFCVIFCVVFLACGIFVLYFPRIISSIRHCLLATHWKSWID